MDTLIALAQRDLHPFLTHFPIALLIVSVVTDLVARRRAELRPVGWVALLIGTAMTIPSVITGLIAHLPYEESAVAGAIEVHQYLAFGTTALFLVLTAWRWRTRRRGDDAAIGLAYPVVALVGLALILAVGWTGGRLVFTNGVGVSGVTP